jgi:hypothetical protein
MAADIAGIYDKNAYLTREQMIYCLVRHTAAQAVRDSVVRVGERILVQGVSLGAMQAIAREVGISITPARDRKGGIRMAFPSSTPPACGVTRTTIPAR